MHRRAQHGRPRAFWTAPRSRQPMVGNCFWEFGHFGIVPSDSWHSGTARQAHAGTGRERELARLQVPGRSPDRPPSSRCGAPAVGALHLVSPSCRPGFHTRQQSAGMESRPTISLAPVSQPAPALPVRCPCRRCAAPRLSCSGVVSGPRRRAGRETGPNRRLDGPGRSIVAIGCRRRWLGGRGRGRALGW